jgi:phosphatidylserine decarboxylase
VLQGENVPVDHQSNPAQSGLTADEEMPRGRVPLEPMDPRLTSIQPGGGVCMRIELAWGRWRRWYLRTFRRAYVARMKELRLGDENGCPFEPLDPRDVKFYRNQGGYHWATEHDPFGWRDRLPFARSGLAELLIFAGGAFALAAALAWLYPLAAWIPAVFGLFFLWFFRNPKRVPPSGEGQVVSPADGLVVSIDEIEHDEHIGGPAVAIGIFLSVFNVHINRVPSASRVIGLSYVPGKFLNALRPSSARENEQVALRLEETDPPHRRIVVRQIAGAIARRIVCWVRPGDELRRGEQFGMIKLGSRTELVLPREPGLVVEVRKGQKVKAGSSLMASYTTPGVER